MATVYLGLGANLGNRDENIDLAVAALRQDERLRVEALSDKLETDPAGGPEGQPKFLNAAAKIETGLKPEELLAILKDIEARLGRKSGPKWGPRTIDIDILLYGDKVLSQPGLEVPHPRMHERRFVLIPLAQIAPEVVHPRLRKTVRRLLAELESQEP